MTTQDYEPFVAEFSRISAALERYRLPPKEASLKADAYFHVLKKFPLADVIAKADTWLDQETRMPKPADWANVIPRRQTQAPDLRTMTDAEAKDYARAESLRYDDAPCDCALCVHAGVSEKPLRFVPECDRDDRPVHVRDAFRDRIVTAGHWAHGAELAGYYRAKEAFFATFRRFNVAHGFGGKPKTKRSFKDRLEAIFAPPPIVAIREPGEDDE